MPATRRSLDYLINESTGSLKDANNITAAQMRDAIASVYHLDHAADVSITGTATATIGKWHVCTGTSSNYTVTLPAASGNAGSMIGFRMSPALTKLVTIDANSTELIDGAQTRVMWANEVAVLFCDGSGWTKVGGKSLPIFQRCVNSSSPAAVQTISNATMTVVDMVTATNDPIALVDLTNNRISAPRPSVYNLSGIVYYNTGFTASRLLSRIFKNGSELFGAEIGVGNSGSYAFSRCEDSVSLVAGDYVDLQTYQNSGGNASIFGSQLNILTVMEVPQW